MARTARRTGSRAAVAFLAAATLVLTTVVCSSAGAAAADHSAPNGIRPGRDESSRARSAGGSSPAPLSAPTPLPEHYALAEVWRAAGQDRYLYHPEGIDVGRDGLVLIAERGNHRVSVWHADGEESAKWGERGTAPGEFEAPEDVAVDLDRGRVYVADTGNQRVQVLSRAGGAVEAVWDDVGSPRGIAVGPNGRVYVSDAAAHKIRVYDVAGQQLAVWGGPERGSDEGQFDTPLGITVGPDGLVYVADSGNQRIQWLDPSVQPGSEAHPVGSLSLDNTDWPGGVPRDVGIDESGQLYVAVDRGILRFRSGNEYAETIKPVRVVDDPDCPIPGRCKLLYSIPENHEGVRRVSVTPGGGLYYTYSPGLRYGDAAFASAARGFPRLIGTPGTGPNMRRAYDPSRIDAGREPYHAHVLDTSGLARIYRRTGQWYDGMRAFPAAMGMDIAAGRTFTHLTGVLTGNQVEVQSLQCFLGCDPAQIPILDPEMMTRRDKTGSPIPDAGWWLTRVAMNRGLAVLDSGKQRIVVRDSFRCETEPAATMQPCDPPSECKRTAPRCPENPMEFPLRGSVQLNRSTDPFRSFSDLTYETAGGFAVLAKDGHLTRVDARGRTGEELALESLAPRTAEALAIGGSGAAFVITSDGWVFKHDGAGRPRAAWEIAAEAGPGRYRDLAVDDIGRVLIPDGENDRILVYQPTGSPAPKPLPPPDGGACDVAVDKTASPTRLLLGDTTRVSLDVDGDCGPHHAALDIALVIDTSCQMGGERFGPVRQAAADLVSSMHLPDDHIAVVSFADELGGARLRSPLTDDRSASRSAVESLQLDCLPPLLYPGRRGDGRISDGLRVGREALFSPLGRDDAGKVIVLISSSLLDREWVEREIYGRWIEGSIPATISERQTAMWEAWSLWELGVRVYTLGIGEGGMRIGPPPEPTPDLQSTHPPDEGLLAAMARPASGYRFAEPNEVGAVVAELGSELQSRLLFESLTVNDRLPSNMRLVPGSLSPPAETLPDGALRWHMGEVGPEGPPSMSYLVEPLEPGLWPTNVEAVAQYRDGRGNEGQAIFPVPTVEVLAPTPSATPTDIATPTLTPTPSPTQTATPPPSPTPTNTQTAAPTRAPEPIFLPILHRQACESSRVPVDVALVIDTSSSMAGAKLPAAVDAARTFIDLLNLPRDHAAVVTFDASSHRLQRLTGDGAKLKAALSGLSTRVGTRIDLGLWDGLDAVAGPDGRPTADPVLVLLTDGRPQGGSEGSTRTAAQVGQELGVTVYCIGLGSDVDPHILAEIAGDTRRVYLTPDAKDLARIYAEVAREIPCR